MQRISYSFSSSNNSSQRCSTGNQQGLISFTERFPGSLWALQSVQWATASVLRPSIRVRKNLPYWKINNFSQGEKQDVRKWGEATEEEFSQDGQTYRDFACADLNRTDLLIMWTVSLLFGKLFPITADFCRWGRTFKWNSRQNTTEAFFVNVYESNLRVKAYLWRKRHF